MARGGNTGILYLAGGFILLAGFIWLATQCVSPALFGYDEADYAFDAGLGFVANYTDTPTLPLIDFLREGLGRGKAPAERAALSEAIRQSNDIVFYRHWHGPLYFYWLIPATAFTHDELMLRTASLVIPVVSFLVILLGCRWLTEGWEGRLQGLLGGALFLWSWTTLGSTELAPHQLFVCCYLLGLFALAKLMATGERRYLYLAAFAAGLAFCTLEVTFVLIATILVCVFLERHRLALDWRLALRAVGVFIGTVLVLWPGAILKLSFVKAYLFMAYLAVFRKAPWGHEGLLDTWMQRVGNSPVEWLVIAGALGLFLSDRRVRANRTLYPFLIFALLMVGATLRVTTGTPRYALPFMPALQVFSGLVVGSALARRPARVAVACAAAIGVALFASACVVVKWHPPGADTRMAQVMELIRANHLDQAALLVPQDYLPSVHYYFPHTHLRGYAGDGPAAEDLAASGLTGVIYRTDPVSYTSAQKLIK